MTDLAAFNRRDRLWHPPQYAPGYKTSVLRSPRRALLSLEMGSGEKTGPRFGHNAVDPLDNDMIRNGIVTAEPVGERVVVHGQVLDEFARPVRNTLLEVWQANAGGKYRHVNDRYKAADDPNFLGLGRCMTDENGHYFFRTIRPGPYPWRNNGSDWRPAHIHFSLFGEAFAQRLITQMYFEGDPLIPLCPIINTISDLAARNMLVAKLDMANQVPFDSLTYRFDIVLRGRRQTFFENKKEGF